MTVRNPSSSKIGNISKNNDNAGKNNRRSINKDHLYYIVKLFLGITILIIIIYNLDINSLYLTIREFKLIYIIPLLLLYIIMHLISAVNMQFLLNPGKIKIAVLKLFRYILVSFSLGQISPGRIGEFSLFLFLKKEGASLGLSSAAVLIDRIITVILLGLFAIIGFPLFFNIEQSFRLSLIIVVVITLILLCIILLFSNTVRNSLKTLIPKPIRIKFTGFSRILRRYFKEDIRYTTYNSILTIPKIAVSALILHFILIGLDTHVSFPYVFIIYVISAIISMIPITISGLGIKEGISIVLFQQIGVEAVVAGSAMLLWLFFRYAEVFLALMLLTSKEDWKDLSTIKKHIKNRSIKEFMNNKSVNNKYF